MIRYSFVTAIIAGGPKTNDPLDVLPMALGAMDAGANGVAFGRKVWGSSDPVAVVRALIRVVRDQVPVEDAAEALIEQDGRIAATPGSAPLQD